MSKNGNENILLNENPKKKESENKLVNEGIIFKRRILNHKNDNKIISLKSNHNKKDLSIKVTEQYVKKGKNNLNFNYANNIPGNSMRTKKSSFTKMSYIAINDVPKGSIKKNNYIKTTNINKKNCSQIPTQNNSRRSTIKGNSCQKIKNNSKRKSLNIIDFSDKNYFYGGSLSPRTSICKIENGHLSPLERSKFYINTNIDRDNGYEKQTFNYKKWNKITINNIFDKYTANANIINMYESPKNINNGIDKENNGLNSNQNRININDNGIQEIVIQNIKKQKKLRISDIPINRKKNKNKENFYNYNTNIINRNNIFNYCRQMSDLALTRDEKNNFIGETLNGLRFDQIIRSPEINNKIKVNNNGFKRYKSSNKKTNSNEGLLTENIPFHHHPDSFSEFDIKNQKLSPKPKNTTKHTMNKSLNLNNYKFNLDYPNKGIYRNEINTMKPNATEMNEHVIKIKNSNLIDFIKTDDIKICNKKVIVFNKFKNNEIEREKDEDTIKEDNMETKKELCDINEEIFNSNTDLLSEKDKCLNNNYTFDNKFEIDSEASFKNLNNCNNNNNINMNNSNNSNNMNINLSNNINKNNADEISIHNSVKHNVFTKKKIGGVNLRTSNINKDDKNNNNKNKNKSGKKDPKSGNKENIRNNNNNLFKNNKYNGDYMELAKICANQEKIISDLVKNVQQLNNKICDKDLCINELNNQLYSIKYDLLNTLQKTNGK